MAKTRTLLYVKEGVDVSTMAAMCRYALRCERVFHRGFMCGFRLTHDAVINGVYTSMFSYAWRSCPPPDVLIIPHQRRWIDYDEFARARAMRANPKSYIKAVNKYQKKFPAYCASVIRSLGPSGGMIAIEV